MQSLLRSTVRFCDTISSSHQSLHTLSYFSIASPGLQNIDGENINTRHLFCQKCMCLIEKYTINVALKVL